MKTTAPPLRPTPLPESSPAERRGIWVILMLYALFFCLWGAGYLLGLYEETPDIILGLPAWFVLSSLVSFALIVPALLFAVRRYFS